MDMDYPEAIQSSTERISRVVPPDSYPEYTSAPVEPDSPYQHAPPKNGDPWTALLTPELEADTTRCNAWKDEVQNLLIFAGLFSAVVTAFVIESYKLLQPDPNDTIISLLSMIVNGQNKTFPPPPTISSNFVPFSQTGYSVRINVCWFISLILSLATVLVGTIALQWLREHQLYVGYSGKEKLAILHMRKEAAEAWYLPQVFAMLPLLLQAALVLFLVGLIDFSLPLGKGLAIPVSIVIGLTLLFLSATTLLPSLQGLSFLCPLYPRKSLPNPCPFKSPQSHALQTLFGIILRATLYRIHPPPSLKFDLNTLQWVIKNPSAFLADPIAPSLYNLWHRRTWHSFDREWLNLRDAYHQCLLDDDPDLFQHRFFWRDSFPLSDVSLSLVKIVKQMPGPNSTDSYLGALIHCFQELAGSIWMEVQIQEDFLRKDRRNNYFEQLCGDSSCSMAKFLLHGGVYNFDRFKEDQYGYHKRLQSKITQRLLCDDQTLCRLGLLSKRHHSPAIARYQRELWSRTLRFCSHAVPLVPVATDVNGSFVLPTIIAENTIYAMLPYHQSSDQIFSATANVLGALLESASSHLISRDPSMNALCTQPQMVKVLDALALLTDKYLQFNLDDTAKQSIDYQFITTFKFVDNHFSKRLADPQLTLQTNSFDVAFYLSSIFIWELLDWTTAQEVLANKESAFGQALESLLNSLHKTWSSGQNNELIEARFKGYRGDRFSDDWWHQLFKHVMGRRSFRQVSTAAVCDRKDSIRVQTFDDENS